MSLSISSSMRRPMFSKELRRSLFCDSLFTLHHSTLREPELCHYVAVRQGRSTKKHLKSDGIRYLIRGCGVAAAWNCYFCLVIAYSDKPLPVDSLPTCYNFTYYHL